MLYQVNVHLALREQDIIKWIGKNGRKAWRKRMIKLHFYLADRADKESLDDLIAGWTKPFNKGTPPYSHVEFERDGMCVSATLRGKNKGVRMEKVSVVIRNLSRWHRYGKEFTNTEEKIMWIRAMKILGRPYARVGLVLSFISLLGWFGTWLSVKLNHWYCSMTVWYILTGEKKRVSPRRLVKWIKKMGFVRG